MVALTHAGASPCTHVKAVASVAVAIIGAPSVHADASSGTAGLCLTLVHVWKERQARRHQRQVVSPGQPGHPAFRLPPPPSSSPPPSPPTPAHQHSSGAAGVTGSLGCSGRSNPRAQAHTVRGHRYSGSVGTHPSLGHGVKGNDQGIRAFCHIQGADADIPAPLIRRARSHSDLLLPHRSV